MYEQDGNNKNGKELISWRVLKVEKSRVLLISQKILDSLTYSEASTAKFEASAFDKQIQASFAGSPFLPDADELDEYFSYDSDRIAHATKYARKMALEEGGEPDYYWTSDAQWVRLYSTSIKVHSVVTDSGDFFGVHALETYGFRPAIWIKR